jgi:hypothetical protein
MINQKPTLEELEAELAPTLRNFRTASTLYAERTQSLLPSRRITPGARASQWRRWTFAVTMACVLVTVVSFRLVKPSSKPDTKTSSTLSEGIEPKNISDEALLENVASDLSSSVATPLQSLAPQQSTSTTVTQ